MSNKRPLRLNEIIEKIPTETLGKVDEKKQSAIDASTASYLNSMYGVDDEEEGEVVVSSDAPRGGVSEPTIKLTSTDKTITFVVDGKTVVVPSLRYMTLIEEDNLRLRRDITRLNAQVRNLRERSNTFLGQINDLWQSLSGKLDKRDSF